MPPEVCTLVQHPFKRADSIFAKSVSHVRITAVGLFWVTFRDETEKNDNWRWRFSDFLILWTGKNCKFSVPNPQVRSSITMVRAFLNRVRHIRRNLRIVRIKTKKKSIQKWDWMMEVLRCQTGAATKPTKEVWDHTVIVRLILIICRRVLHLRLIVARLPSCCLCVVRSMPTCWFSASCWVNEVWLTLHLANCSDRKSVV